MGQVPPDVRRVWFGLLFGFTLLVIASSFPGGVRLPPLLTLIFFACVPGYGFVSAFLPRLSPLEKVGASVLINIALLVGIRELLETTARFSAGTSATTYPSIEFGVLAVLSLPAFAFRMYAPISGRANSA